MLHPFLGVEPQFDETNYIAPSADVIGDVRLGSHASIWFNTTVRGDVHRIRIGERSNVQDNSVIHVTNGDAPTHIGANVTIGHSAVVHGCTVEDRVLIGMGTTVLDHAVVGSDSIVGANALITGGTEIPPRSLVLGSPAKVVRELSDEEVDSIRAYADHYVRYNAIYRGEETPETNPFYDVQSDR